MIASRSRLSCSNRSFDKKLAPEQQPDCIVADFQDAVPLGLKAAARKGLQDKLDHQGLIQDRPVMVRVNEHELWEKHHGV
jgi:citrate lyase beta subunit